VVENACGEDLLEGEAFSRLKEKGEKHDS